MVFWAILAGSVVGQSAGPSPRGGVTTVMLSVSTATGSELRFVPDRVSVAPAAPVRLIFHNASSEAHNLTFQGDLGVGTRTIVRPGESEGISFVSPAVSGTYRFTCTIHEGMVGLLIVP